MPKYICVVFFVFFSACDIYGSSKNPNGSTKTWKMWILRNRFSLKHLPASKLLLTSDEFAKFRKVSHFWALYFIFTLNSCPVWNVILCICFLYSILQHRECFHILLIHAHFWRLFSRLEASPLCWFRSLNFPITWINKQATRNLKLETQRKTWTAALRLVIFGSYLCLEQ